MRNDSEARTGLYTARVDGRDVYSNERLSKVLYRLMLVVRSDHLWHRRDTVDAMINELETNHELTYPVFGDDPEDVWEAELSVGFVFTKGS